MSAVTASELLHGVRRATPPHQAAREAYVEKLLVELPVIPFDLDVARVHAELAAELASRGTPVGTNDLMIAATAVQLGYAVLTFDQRSYPAIPRLKTQTP